jgi:hypothetical protein
MRLDKVPCAKTNFELNERKALLWAQEYPNQVVSRLVDCSDELIKERCERGLGRNSEAANIQAAGGSCCLVHAAASHSHSHTKSTRSLSRTRVGLCCSNECLCVDCPATQQATQPASTGTTAATDTAKGCAAWKERGRRLRVCYVAAEVIPPSLLWSDSGRRGARSSGAPAATAAPSRRIAARPISAHVAGAKRRAFLRPHPCRQGSIWSRQTIGIGACAQQTVGVKGGWCRDWVGVGHEKRAAGLPLPLPAIYKQNDRLVTQKRHGRGSYYIEGGLLGLLLVRQSLQTEVDRYMNAATVFFSNFPVGKMSDPISTALF